VSFVGRRLFFLGLARSGLGASTYMKEHQGAEVWGWDDKAEQRILAQEKGLYLCQEGILWKDFDALVLSPGIPLYGPKQHFLVAQALGQGIPVISDLELFIKLYPQAPIVAITGSNGKSTVTALTCALLKGLGYASLEAGNNGMPIFKVLQDFCEKQRSQEGPFGSCLPTKQNVKRSCAVEQSFENFLKKTIFVLEISSFQLELTPSLAPRVAVLTSVVPDHLDRHGTFDHYKSIKFSIFKNARGKVMGITSPTIKDFYEQLSLDEQSSYKTIGPSGDFRIEKDGLYDGRYHPTLYQDWPKEDASNGAWGENALIIPWPSTVFGHIAHNRENMGLALACVSLWMDQEQGLGGESLEKGQKPCHLTLRNQDKQKALHVFEKFKGLAHRQEIIAQERYVQESFKDDQESFSPSFDGTIVYVNDSKATNLASVALTLEGFSKYQIFWILGGIPKAPTLEEVHNCLSYISKAFLIGQGECVYYDELVQYGVWAEKCGTLERAFEKAVRQARICMLENLRKNQKKPIALLLSPGCASLDQFAHFEERGDRFRVLVQNAIAGKETVA
jgi:UDP-N-acetylmuramoylalanine--D-glutamate ligase